MSMGPRECLTVQLALSTGWWHDIPNPRSGDGLCQFQLEMLLCCGSRMRTSWRAVTFPKFPL